MEAGKKAKPAALLIADILVLNGIVMSIVYLTSEQWGEALLVALLAILGVVYLVRNGVYWPGQSLYRYWRRYVF